MVLGLVDLAAALSELVNSSPDLTSGLVREEGEGEFLVAFDVRWSAIEDPDGELKELEVAYSGYLVVGRGTEGREDAWIIVRSDFGELEDLLERISERGDVVGVLSVRGNSVEVVVYPERAASAAAVGLAGELVEALLERLGWPEGIFYSLIGYEVISGGLRLYASLAVDECPSWVIHEHAEDHAHGHAEGHEHGHGHGGDPGSGVGGALPSGGWPD